MQNESPNRPVIATEQIELDTPELFPAFLRLRQHFGEEKVFLLESFSAGPSRDARRSYIGFNPLLKVRVSHLTAELSGVPPMMERVRSHLAARDMALDERGSVQMPSAPALWDLLRTVQEAVLLCAGERADLSRLGFFGYFGYDVAHAIEVLPKRIAAPEEFPDAELSIHQGLLELDIPAGTATLHLHQAPGLWEPLTPSVLLELLAREVPEPGDITPPSATLATLSRGTYEEGVKRALQHIAAGDIYQVQLGHELLIESDADPLAVYRRLRERNPSPYMYVAPFSSFTLVGASPELYVRASGNTLTMRPIAGTVKRTVSDTENERLVDRLQRDEKEVAEHIMLVDLCRNDLGRVCTPRSLAVDELLAVERYSHVFHLVSNVTAARQPTCDIYEVIKATFPAGTMTGAPKIRAMEIIESIEATRRGPYAGAIGLIGFDGQANLALCIRTAVRTGDHYRLRASAGVVADSAPDREWAETLHKMAALYWAITGEEIPHESIGY